MNLADQANAEVVSFTRETPPLASSVRFIRLFMNAHTVVERVTRRAGAPRREPGDPTPGGVARVVGLPAAAGPVRRLRESFMNNPR